MKRKLIAGVLSTVLAFTMLSTGSVTEVKAEEMQIPAHLTMHSAMN